MTDTSPSCLPSPCSWPWPPPSGRRGRRAGCRCCRPSPRSASGPRATATPATVAWFVLGATVGGLPSARWRPGWPRWSRPPSVRRPVAPGRRPWSPRWWSLVSDTGPRRGPAPGPLPPGQRAVARRLPALGLRRRLRVPDRLRAGHLHHHGRRLPDGGAGRPDRRPAGRPRRGRRLRAGPRAGRDPDPPDRHARRRCSPSTSGSSPAPLGRPGRARRLPGASPWCSAVAVGPGRPCRGGRRGRSLRAVRVVAVGRRRRVGSGAVRRRRRATARPSGARRPDASVAVG